ncbi:MULTISPECIES: hypothetical protein [Sanguibacteroides]|uniref:Phage major capsid protein n=1 Tax=Sanguibacteroides justesenii TaxID=1547597 RepID=A0AB34R8I0_9PORP|nr:MULTISPECIES: hypothetical protein [Sanguibacteroides]KIO45458.1 hypothetical protein IE90_08605 [Sanguibacteroides justesenii]PXZ44740.1 hypothetical protein DMB45_04700 [Sanguibacteroides justesenii]
MPNTITEKLVGSAEKYRKQLLQLPAIGVSDALIHMTPRPGVSHKETTGWMTGDFELRPYTGEKNAGKNIGLDARTIETFLGSCVEEFDPNILRDTIYAQLYAKGGKIEDAEIHKGILMKIMKTLLKKLNKNLFSAVRKDSGTTTSDLFNGFDTITKKEITAGNIAAAKGNYKEIEIVTAQNAVDILKSVYRAASDELRNEESKLFIPQTVYDAYCDDYQTTVGAAPYNKAFEKTFLEGSQNMCELVPLVSKKGSDYFQLTTKDNMLYGYGNGVEKETVRVREGDNPFLLQFVAAMFFGVEYEYIGEEKLLIAEQKAPVNTGA